MAEPLRVLVNDDSPSDAALLVRELKVEIPGAVCEISCDRETFAEALQNGPWDVIVSDFSLPGFNALDALALTREIDTEVPFIVMSGTIGEERAAELIRAGVTDYVMKDHLGRVSMMVDRAVREARERQMLGQAERDLVEAANEWRDTVNAIPEAILMLDAEGRVRRMNEAAGRLAGIGCESLVGMSWREVLGALCPESCELPAAPFETERLHFEWGPCVDSRWFVVSYDPVRNESGTLTGFVMVFIDMTERKLADAAQIELLEQLRQTLKGSVSIAIKMVESRDPYTAGHQENVAKLALAIAHGLPVADVDFDVVKMAAQLHDIGKIAVPAEILVRPGQLDATEWAIIKKHPAVAEEILREAQFDDRVVETVVQHHERLDGSGYPKGLKGEDIHMEARILAVADVAEAMMAHRPYRPARPTAAAFAELRDGRGVRYDSHVVDACLGILEKNPGMLARPQG